VSVSVETRAPAPSHGGRRGAWLALGGALVVAVAALVVVASRGPSVPPTFEQRIQSIAAELRCPVCQNLSVADSPSELARQMRAEIGRRLRLGQSEEQIDGFFIAKYGRWILLTPDAGGIGLFAWLAPALAVAAGAGLAWMLVVRRRGRSVADPTDDGPRLTDAERARVQHEVDALTEDA
jgi:cytochrome c-type biogenesis protein CcmH